MRPPPDNDIDAPPDPKPRPVGEWIRRAREGLGLTRMQLADKAGVSLVALKRLETRPTWPFDVDVAQKLVAVILAEAPEFAASAPRL